MSTNIEYLLYHKVANMIYEYYEYIYDVFLVLAFASTVIFHGQSSEGIFSRDCGRQISPRAVIRSPFWDATSAWQTVWTSPESGI